MRQLADGDKPQYHFRFSFDFHVRCAAGVWPVICGSMYLGFQSEIHSYRVDAIVVPPRVVGEVERCFASTSFGLLTFSFWFCHTKDKHITLENRQRKREKRAREKRAREKRAREKRAREIELDYCVHWPGLCAIWWSIDDLSFFGLSIFPRMLLLYFTFHLLSVSLTSYVHFIKAKQRNFATKSIETNTSSVLVRPAHSCDARTPLQKSASYSPQANWLHWTDAPANLMPIWCQSELNQACRRQIRFFLLRLVC